MNFPNNPDYYVKIILALVIIAGAIYLQATANAVPEWLAIAVAAVLTFFFGVSTTPHNGE